MMVCWGAKFTEKPSIELKNIGIALLENYQPSHMGIQKWHFLDHFVDAITKVEGIDCFYGGL